MFWNKEPGWFGKQLAENSKALANGDFSKIPWVFCVFAEEHNQSKLLAAKAFSNTLDELKFDDIIRIDVQMRQTTSMEWSIDWRKLRIENFFTNTMNINERRAVMVFSSFNPNGFIREQAVRMMAEYAGTLPYIILRQNDWVVQIRQVAAKSFEKRLKYPSDGEILNALPFAEKLKWSSRGSHGEYTRSFFKKLTSPEHREDLANGLHSDNVRTRKICIQALLDSPCPSVERALQHLKCEPDPFLRKIIYEKLCHLKQDMAEYSYLFLCDRYPANRLLALQYLYAVKKNEVLPYAQRMLLDRSVRIRAFSRKIVHEYLPDFEFSAFYLEHIEDNTVSAILGLCETGQKADVAIIEGYLRDERTAVVQTAVVALMSLNSEKYLCAIIEMLGDCRMGVVKTTHKLLVKHGIVDYTRIQEIFLSTMFEYGKIQCAVILFSASKWQSLIYMLEALPCETESIRKLAIQYINRWLFRFNQSFVAATVQQKETIYQLIYLQGELLPPALKRNLLFVLK